MNLLRKKKEQKEEPSFWEYHELAQYNSEINRGIVHTSKWDEKMRLQQKSFDAQMLAEARAKGHIIVGTGTGGLVEGPLCTCGHPVTAHGEQGGEKGCFGKGPCSCTGFWRT